MWQQLKKCCYKNKRRQHWKIWGVCGNVNKMGPFRVGCLLNVKFHFHFRSLLFFVCSYSFRNTNTCAYPDYLSSCFFNIFFIFIYVYGVFILSLSDSDSDSLTNSIELQAQYSRRICRLSAVSFMELGARRAIYSVIHMYLCMY